MNLLPFTEVIQVTTADGAALRVLKCLSPIGSEAPTLVLIHGAGMSAYSWSPCVEYLMVHFNVYSFELRGHGESGGKAEELSAERLVSDVLAGLEQLKLTDVFLVGHSLGGAVAIRVASAVPSVVMGLVVVDMVEGTAVNALRFMPQYLKNRPEVFATENNAIVWFVAEGGMRNRVNAARTVPHLLRQRADGMFSWRADLPATAPHWDGWFAGCDELFLTCRASKLLVLAGTDRLDKELTIA
eukprot:PhM_4_TR14198/c0_g1_i2/m.27955/K13617/PPME1; protein phosphatase methylesterase 1